VVRYQYQYQYFDVWIPYLKCGIQISCRILDRILDPILDHMAEPPCKRFRTDEPLTHHRIICIAEPDRSGLMHSDVMMSFGSVREVVHGERLNTHQSEDTFGYRLINAMPNGSQSTDPLSRSEPGSEPIQSDIELVAKQAQVSEEVARKALITANNDIVDAIINILP
jgi:NACalpha-BTF3-like transcription factor